MDTSHWSQGNNNIINIGVVKPMEENSSNSMVERRTKPPQKDQTLNCPRCNSTNTKFCYYNNYSLSQPRYICKTCRRYWTEGGSLRNVPVGGGSRKNKRSSISSNISSSSPPASNSTKKIAHHDHLNPSLNFPQSASQNPKIQQGQDLNLAYPPTDQDNNINFESFSRLVEVPNYQKNHGSSSSTSSHVSAMELLKSAGIGSRGLMNSFMPMSSMVQDSNAIFSSGLIPNLQEFKPNLNFGLDGFESGYGVEDNCSNARLLFPTNEDLKQQVSSTSTTTEFINDQQNRGQGGNNNSAGYWNGMLGGGSW